MEMKIGLLGHGVVGSGVTSITDSCAGKKVRRLEVSRILVKDEWEMTDPRCTMNVDDIISDPDIEIVAECMGGIEPAHTFVRRALEAGKHVVTSNKKMFAAKCSELLDLARENGVTVRYEASCGGGIPWISNLARIRRLEAVTSFCGIFNGTTNYILSRMTETGSEFDQNLAEAQRLGYAERDPSDDIDGFDVRYKTAITAMRAFGVIADVNDIPTFGIRNAAVADIRWGKENKRVLKLFGAGENLGDAVSLWVMPVFVSTKNVFAHITDNFNAVEADSPTLGKAMFTGQGAGSLPTAHAVVQDLLDIYQNQDSDMPDPVRRPVSADSVKTKFYIRTAKPECFADLKESDAGEHAFLTKEIALSELVNAVKGCGDDTVFAAMVRE